MTIGNNRTGSRKSRIVRAAGRGRSSRAETDSARRAADRAKADGPAASSKTGRRAAGRGRAVNLAVRVNSASRGSRLTATETGAVEDPADHLRDLRAGPRVINHSGWGNER